MMSKDPPPPPGHPLIHHFGHAGLCRAEVKHIDQFQTSYYHLVIVGLCRAQDTLGCQLTGSTKTLYLLKLRRFHCCQPVQPCLRMSHDPPPPSLHTPFIYQFGHAGLCRAQMKHSYQLQPSYYRFDSTGLCRAQHPIECKFTLCSIAVTWWIAQSCCNLPSSMGPVHTGTKTQVARILKKFSHRLGNFGAWQGSWEYSESTPWPPLQALLKAGLWTRDRDQVEAHCRLLVRPLLNNGKSNGK